ncbi:helicase RepA family protein [Ferrimonas balearica]|uniref:helicase RepA family protein n=1 Tax=Ferrimonas balearica TaxID=44012 RepID=UPI001C58014F|nr:helicase RepA family protein [Ferrimonas balearica]MBW3140461.1 helicase RepA family protein [Ferrimonas balearica]
MTYKSAKDTQYLAVVNSGLPEDGYPFSLKQSFHGYDQEFRYLIKGYLPACCLCMVYGASGTFKSFHALNWAVHVALGRRWNGCRVNQAPVLYIIGEGGHGVLQRIKALADEYNNGAHISNLYRIDHAVPLSDPRAVHSLSTQIKAKEKELGCSFGLIVIDTLARCFGPGDENKSDEMNRFISACDIVRAETGATVLVVHHSGKADKQSARGSSALRAACDAEFRVERVGQNDPAFVLVSTKMKDGVEPQRQLFQLHERVVRKDCDGEDITTLVCGQNGFEVGEFEANEPKASPKELLVLRAVQQLVDDGLDVRRADVLALLKNAGHDTKHFARWLNGTIKKGLIGEQHGQLILLEDTDFQLPAPEDY